MHFGHCVCGLMRMPMRNMNSIGRECNILNLSLSCPVAHHTWSTYNSRIIELHQNVVCPTLIRTGRWKRNRNWIFHFPWQKRIRERRTLSMVDCWCLCARSKQLSSFLFNLSNCIARRGVPNPVVLPHIACYRNSRHCVLRSHAIIQYLHNDMS